MIRAGRISLIALAAISNGAIYVIDAVLLPN
jgi:uncharacterized surface protein with fasciclin (FAS1) repeats